MIKIERISYQKLQFTYPLASVKDFQATEEALSPQERTSSTSKHEISYFFSTQISGVSYLQVADSHHFNADPDPDFHFNADQEPVLY
jgi:hypothetical protein